MKIQVISYDKKVKYGTEHEYIYSSLNEPISLDAFDLNIISLQTEALWTNKGNDTRSIDSIDDFKSMKELIGSVKKSQVIICFPKNYVYKYAYYSNQYQHTCKLKDMIPKLSEFLKQLIPSGHPYEIVYENSETICEDTKYSSAFYFDNVLEGSRVLSKCIGGEHCTTYRANSKLIFTTLDLSKTDSNINLFLKSIGLIEQQSELPVWVDEFEFLDDKIQKDAVKNANEEIQRQKQKIESASQKIEENLRYKSVLYETGDALVKVVFDMLEKMLNYDLSTFEDRHKEDFLIKKDGITFVGEVKGITSNVRSSNISQTETHAKQYAELLEDEGKAEENIKPLLIVNSLRNMPINERKPINEDQRHMAETRGILVITTDVLLYLFENFLNKTVSKEKILDLLTNKVGILDKKDFLGGHYDQL